MKMGRLAITWLILTMFAVSYFVLYMYSDEPHHHIVFNIYLAAGFIVTAIEKATKDLHLQMLAGLSSAKPQS